MEMGLKWARNTNLTASLGITTIKRIAQRGNGKFILSLN